MRKLLVLALCFVMSVIVFGCTSSTSASSSITSSQTAQSSAKLSDDQKQDIAKYLQLDEIVALDNALTDASKNLIDYVKAGNSEEIDRRFIALSNALSDAEKVDVPAICKTLHYNKMQSARALIIALGEFSEALTNPSERTQKIDEATSYVDQSTEFIEAYEAEIKRLTELAK